jgi:hypothetical protein
MFSSRDERSESSGCWSARASPSLVPQPRFTTNCSACLSDPNGIPSQLARHLRRVEWAKEHVRPLVEWIVPEAGNPKKWRIKHAIVAEPIPVSSVVVESGEPVFTISEVRYRLTI